VGKYSIGDKFVVEIKGIEDELYRVSEDRQDITKEETLDKFDRLDYEYVNEHFGDLQDIAYEKGKKDAWKLAGRISGYTPDVLNEIDMSKIFGTRQREEIYEKFTVNQAIQLIKEYEANNRMEVGDIVLTENGEAVMTSVDNGSWHMVLVQSGIVKQVCRGSSYVKNKTGRSIDICNLLKEAAGVDRQGLCADKLIF
jgi:hypothetical protein